MGAPPEVGLCSPAFLAEIVAECGGCYFSFRDIMNCFYECRIPPSLSQYFGLQTVKASELGVAAVGVCLSVATC